MQVIKKIGMTVGLLALLLWLYPEGAYLHFVEGHADQYLQFQKVKDCDVIYFSASSNFPSEFVEEQDPRKLSQFIADDFPNLRFEAFNKPASHAGVFAHLLEMFRKDGDAKTFIVTMNLRSFGSDWVFSELETPLNQAAVCYNHRPNLINRALVSLRAYDDLSTEERVALRTQAWDSDPLPFPSPMNTVTSWCAVEKWGDWRNPKRQLADQFIKQYGFVLNEQNPRVQDFDKIAKMAQEEGWTMVFNLLAENTQKADSLLGSELVGLMNDNADWLDERYENMGIPVINSLNAVDSKHFTDKDFPTEHYDDVGRKIIAKRVAVALKKELAK